MTTYEAPAKLNLSLLVSPPRSDGFHPLESLVQTIAWCDLLTIEEGEGEDTLEIVGAEIDVGENLVLKALETARTRGSVPPLSMSLEKRLPIAAGLGGGSSDAAAALKAAVDLGGLSESLAIEVAPAVGADVALFLTGGSLLMAGVGETITAVEPLSGFSVAIAIPDFALATADSKDIVRSEHDDFLKYNENDLVRLGILGAPVNEGGMWNLTQNTRLLNGAIWQLHTRLQDIILELAETKGQLKLLSAKT